MEYPESYQKILIQCEISNIEYYAREIGTFKKLLESVDDEKIEQWYKYFMYVAENGMEESSERAKQLRQELSESESARESASCTM